MFNQRWDAHKAMLQQLCSAVQEPQLKPANSVLPVFMDTCSDLTSSSAAIQSRGCAAGVLTSDPRIVREARPVPLLTFDEATELAFFGATVLHPSAMQPAMQVSSLDVRVKNSYNRCPRSETLIPPGSGTLTLKYILVRAAILPALLKVSWVVASAGDSHLCIALLPNTNALTPCKVGGGSWRPHRACLPVQESSGHADLQRPGHE